MWQTSFKKSIDTIQRIRNIFSNYDKDTVPHGDELPSDFLIDLDTNYSGTKTQYRWIIKMDEKRKIDKQTNVTKALGCFSEATGHRFDDKTLPASLVDGPKGKHCPVLLERLIKWLSDRPNLIGETRIRHFIGRYGSDRRRERSDYVELYGSDDFEQNKIYKFIDDELFMGNGRLQGKETIELHEFNWNKNFIPTNILHNHDY